MYDDHDPQLDDTIGSIGNDVETEENVGESKQPQSNLGLFCFMGVLMVYLFVQATLFPTRGTPPT